MMMTGRPKNDDDELRPDCGRIHGARNEVQAALARLRGEGKVLQNLAISTLRNFCVSNANATDDDRSRICRNLIRLHDVLVRIATDTMELQARIGSMLRDGSNNLDIPPIPVPPIPETGHQGVEEENIGKLLVRYDQFLSTLRNRLVRMATLLDDEKSAGESR
jgi:hypothetical protein